MMTQIDLDKLIADKNPRLAKKMPGFVKAYLRRILHIREFNGFLAEHSHETGLAFAEAGIEFVGLKTKVIGEEHLDSLTPAPIVAANHPLGGLDGIALLLLIGRRYGTVKLLVNDFLMALTNLEELFVPVNKLGSSRAYRGSIREAIQSGDPLIIFPAGVCSRKVSGGVYDLEWNKSFIRMARETGRPVVPVYVGGKNSRFFYGLANLRHRLKIRFNVEMLFLVDEMMKQRGLTMEVVVGEPVKADVFTDALTDWEWARRLREHVYLMRDGRPQPFDPERRPELPETYFA